MSNALMNLVWKVRLSPKQKLALARCADRANDNGRDIYLSIDTLAIETGLSRSSVFRALAELDRAGLLSDDPDAPPRKSTSRLIHVDTLRERASQSVKSRNTTSRNANGRPRRGKGRGLSKMATRDESGNAEDAREYPKETDKPNADVQYLNVKRPDSRAGGEQCQPEAEDCQAETEQCQAEAKEYQAETKESRSDTQYIPYTSSKHPLIQGDRAGAAQEAPAPIGLSRPEERTARPVPALAPIAQAAPRSSNELPEAVAHELKQRLGNAYSSWYGEVRVIGFDKGVLTLSAPTRFTRDWIKTHHDFFILDAWNRSTARHGCPRIENVEVRVIA